MKISLCNIGNEGKEVEIATSEYNLPPSFVCSSSCKDCYGKETFCTSCRENKILLLEVGECSSDCPLKYARIENY